ncbi:MAG: cytochrome c [Bacteroidia bacterium]|nr:cytochrome c [Bacteroidia bacterium]MCZ2277767.1 cytochrome c [Bacteroidia bacterium]
MQTFNNITGNRLVIAILVCIFIIYNIIIYKGTQPLTAEKLSDDALAGQLLYQKNNCTACHQLYGLGGYLGPDLTNIISTKGKGPEYVKAFLNSGIKSMPRFHFSEKQKDAIVAYLREVDKTGHFPDYNARMHPTGWVEIKTKSE